MVLGLGSRSKKDRASAITQLVELDLHVHEIKPWQGFAKPSKVPILVALRWSRGERLIGSSKNVNPTAANASELGKIVLGESLRIAVAPNREILKRAKKSYPDLDDPLAFTLLDINDPKGKPLAQAALDLSSLASITESKLVAVPFTVSKKVAKGATSYLHLTVQRHQDASSYAASASLGTSGRTSDASSPPPLDEDTQQRLVAALMSDDEDDHDTKEEEIDSFTDEDDEDKKEVLPPSIPQGLSPSQGNGGSRLPQHNAMVNPVRVASGNVHQKGTISPIQQTPEVSLIPSQGNEGSRLLQQNAIAPHPVRVPSGNVHQKATISLIQQIPEKQPERAEEKVSRQVVASAQPSPVKAAAIAAAAAYTKKHSFLPRRNTNSYMNDSDDSFSDRDSAGEDEFPSRFSKVEQSPSVLPKGTPKVGANLQVNSSSVRGRVTASNLSVDKSTKDDVQGKVERAAIADVKATTAQNIAVSSTRESSSRSKDSQTSLNLEAGVHKSFSNENNFSQTVDTSHAKSLVVPEREAVVRTQAKTSPEPPKAKSGVKSPLREKGPQKITISKSPDQMKGRPNQSPVQDSRTSKNAMQEAKAKAFKSPDREADNRVLYAEGKTVSGQSRIQQLEAEVEKLKGELRDVAAVEASLYSTTAEHGTSSMKLHAPARRLARVYLYACKHWSHERRASCARNTVSGLILIARACGNDVPRLTFWWSNTTVLREIVSIALNVLPASPKVGSSAHLSSPADGRIITSSPNGRKLYQKQQAASPPHDCEDWKEPSTFTCALERLESWIYTKVVESIWWQVLTPQMQQPMKQAPSEMDENDLDTRPEYGKHGKRVVIPEVEDARQGNVSVEIWKKAFLDAFERLCPVRILGVQCGCLPMLNRLVLEACVVRLDVAMFNAILRDDEVPTDPVSDPISDVRVLPIPNSFLSFGLGAQLKNAVATLSSCISNLTRKDGANVMSDGHSDDEEKNLVTFPLLKAMGGLLMLPKDMLIDKSLRKEVCPTLQLSFIGRILSKFQPDEFSPEPLTPELLDTINAEVAAEQEDAEDSVTTLRMACSPAVIYTPPQSSMVRQWIGDVVSTNKHLRRSNSSILKKGHTSDDEIDELESPISWLLENTKGPGGNVKRGVASSPKDSSGNCRFMLLREVWNSS